MNDVWIPQKNIYVKYPSYFDEMTSGRDAIKIGEVLFMVFTKQIEPIEGMKLAVDYFLNRKNDIKKPLAGIDAWDYWGTESRLAETMNWMFDEKVSGEPEYNTETEDVVLPDVSYEINPKLTKLHLEKIRLKGRLYYGPGDLFVKLSFVEFKEASACVETFVATGDIELLNRLCAILFTRRIKFWRIRKFLGISPNRLRMKFNELRIEQDIKVIRNSPIGFRFWAFLFFIGSLNYIREEAIVIDGQEYNFSCMFSGGGKSRDNTGLSGVMFSLAESGVFGDLESTGQTDYYDVALRLYQLHMQSLDMKSKTK